MIYFDNSATTLKKPQCVTDAVLYAIKNLGNPGRSFYEPSMEALRTVYKARCEIAKLCDLKEPLSVAFTSGATESLNLVINSLISSDDAVITTVLEHNSVLRPLYNTGCNMSFINCNDKGELLYEDLNKLLKKNTRFLISTHGSNLTGYETETEILSSFCKKHGLIFILDTAQTMGSVEVNADMADIICFTGHKGLFGPQGTGGIITTLKDKFKLVKTGGTGSNTFAPHQPLEMPDIFEAGTLNVHGIAGLQKGVEYINKLGIVTVESWEKTLLNMFIDGISKVKGVTCYSPEKPKLPVVSLNINELPAGDVAYQLWKKWGIATRAGSHCAPLAHKHFKTESRGMVRFSFSMFNTEAEIKTAIDAITEIAAKS